MTLELARKAVEEEHLGQRGVPDLLTVSLSETDFLGHIVGPDSIEMHNQLIALDRELGLFMEFLDRSVGRGKYLFVLSSDHGVLPLPSSEAGKKMGAVRIDQEQFKSALESELEKKLGVVKGSKWLLGLMQPNVYLNLALAKSMNISPKVVLDEAVLILKKNPAIAQVYRPEQLAEGKTLDARAELFRRSYYPNRSGDLLILIKEKVYLAAPENKTGHGLLYDYDARVPLFMLGYGVRPGTYDQSAIAEDLAPTLAQTLGIPLLPKAPGRVLAEALDNEVLTAHAK
jgi:predicted AlkP superfamily pyrophosphatase or phosphodiesterase